MSVIRPSPVATGVESFAVLTPTLPPATHTNSYIIGDELLMLVEPATPYADEQNALIDHLARRQANGARIESLFLTHHHIDHVGGLPALSDALGVPVWAHRATAERLEDQIRIDQTFDDGDVISLGAHRLRVMHTPGHAPGHLCLQHVDARWMIAGDMVASVGTILVEAQDGDMIAYLASLERMRAANPSLLLPAHGDPIVNADEKLSGYIAHRLAREAKVLAALATSAPAATLDDLVPLAYADTPPSVWPLARLSLEAHLLKLEREGRAFRSDGFWRTA